jgi:hypothetical protein
MGMTYRNILAQRMVERAVTRTLREKYGSAALGWDYRTPFTAFGFEIQTPIGGFDVRVVPCSGVVWVYQIPCTPMMVT